MSIDPSKAYRVRRFSTGSATKRYPDCDLGVIQGSDLKLILKNFSYDQGFGMWFSPKSTIGYSVEVLN